MGEPVAFNPRGEPELCLGQYRWPGDESVTVVTVGGTLDVYTAAAARERFIELTGPRECWRIVADLAGCEYIDSTSLGVLIGALKRCRVHDGRLVLAGPRGMVLDSLSITGLTRVFSIYETVDEAVQSLAGGAR